MATLVAGLPSLCGGVYEAVYDPLNRVDDAMILTRLPVIAFEVVRLYGGFRNVLRARLEHPLGPLDVFTTHLAAGSDGAQLPCAGDCPAECVAARRHDAPRVSGRAGRASSSKRALDLATPAVVAGDFNEEPGSFVHAQFTERGWPDTYLVAGNPECDPATGAGCTAGRADDVARRSSSRRRATRSSASTSSSWRRAPGCDVEACRRSRRRRHLDRPVRRSAQSLRRDLRAGARCRSAGRRTTSAHSSI